MKAITTIILGGVTLAAVLLQPGPASEARAQGAIGLQPVVTPFSDGVFLNTTPVVSADRRYVRLGAIEPSFQALRGVQPFGFTAGGVAGGGVPAGIGGFGGLGAVGDPGGLGAVSGSSGTAVVPGLGAVGPVAFGWPGFYGGYPYGYPFPVVSGIPAGPLVTGPYSYSSRISARTTNTMAPMSWSIMNSVAPGRWRPIFP